MLSGTMISWILEEEDYLDKLRGVKGLLVISQRLTGRYDKTARGRHACFYVRRSLRLS